MNPIDFHADYRPCSITWSDNTIKAAKVDNWVRFFLDTGTLILIPFFAWMIIMKRPRYRDMKYVYIQLGLMMVSQILYCTRSYGRIFEDDWTYYGRDTPVWTDRCERSGNIINFFQHWIYAASYFEVGLVFRYTFGVQTLENIEKLQKREKCMKNLNACIYILFTGAFIAVVFINKHAIMDAVYSLCATAMAFLLYFSMNKIRSFLKILEQNGLVVAHKTMLL